MKNRDFHDLPNSLGGTDSKNTKFFNTINLQGSNLAKAKNQAESQETKILDLLKTYSSKNFTKHEIKKRLVQQGIIKENTPESSISRALTNLMNDGLILKLSEMRKGEFDKPNHLWQIKPEPKTAGIQTTLF